jgi:integrase
VAHIQDRGKQHGRRWQARYRDPTGRERSKTFTRKLDAQRWLDEQTADMLTGRYVDPRAGTVTLGTFAERWLDAQTFDATSRQTVTPRLTVHILPHLGDVELRNLRPSMVQAWLRGRQEVVAPSYVVQILTTLSAVLSAAVDDGRIATNPCDSPSVKPPKVERRRVVPWPVDRVHAVVAAHPARYAAVAVVAAGCGLRQGEVLGLRPEDVDFLRRRLLVRRQVRLVAGRPVFALPKGGKEREVPLPDWVAVALAESLRRFAPVPVTLPWGDLDREPATETLMFTARAGGVWNRNEYNRTVWRPALRVVEVPATRGNGMHACRHHYASVVLDAGVSIRALAEYLGHTDPGFTLRTYAHMMPASADRARAAVDAAHAAPHVAPAESGRNGREAR